ncbi:MAG TPA: tyrosine-type recombinase/integrase [Candidatus Acidoferrum sp.]|nr:tyrosine-type recombinase/integrase [Candidatus Acidoferrum sp.]
MQGGHFFISHGSWFVRYRDSDGKQRAQRLAAFDDNHRTLKSVRPLADDILHFANLKEQSPDTSITLQQYVEGFYLPHAKLHKSPSTYRGYRNLYNAQIKPRVGETKMVAFKASHAQKLLDRIGAEEKLSHQSFLNIKNLLSAIFSFAVRQGVIGTKPIQPRSIEIPKGRKTPKTYAYSAQEIETMLAILKGAARAAVAVAAWTGLSLGELRGLRWEDIQGDHLTVRRTYWHQIEGPTKTEARQNAVHLLPAVREILAEHREKNPHTAWVFEGPKETPLDLATLGSKHIKTALEGSGVAWHGWHALRRGLGTRLFAKDVPIEIVSAILRHGSVHVTRKHYVKTLPESIIDAMKKLEEVKS